MVAPACVMTVDAPEPVIHCEERTAPGSPADETRAPHRYEAVAGGADGAHGVFAQDSVMNGTEAELKSMWQSGHPGKHG